MEFQLKCFNQPIDVGCSHHFYFFDIWQGWVSPVFTDPYLLSLFIPPIRGQIETIPQILK